MLFFLDSSIRIPLFVRAMTLASECACRTVLEKLSSRFLQEHQHAKYCSYHFPNESTSAILRHYDECPGVTADSSNKLGDNISSQLDSVGIHHASRGSYLSTFQKLCDNIHSSGLLLTDGGKAIVPSSMTSVDKRFMIRYLVGTGFDLEDILVCDGNGILRSPRNEEIETPPKKRKVSGSTIDEVLK
jgi:hypothetical protein